MNRKNLARNLMIIEQLEELATCLEKHEITVILLKGVSLINIFPDYIPEREMEDIDLLFNANEIEKARDIITSMGYFPVPGDPWALKRHNNEVHIDITDNIWYLSKTENKNLIKRCVAYRAEEFPGKVFHLPPDELFIHVLAHASVHHAIKESKWLTDLNKISEKWKNETRWEILKPKLLDYGLLTPAEIYLDKIENANTNSKFSSKLYRRIVKSKHPLSGHIIRFLFLPKSKKIIYLMDVLFPNYVFLKYRYDLQKRRQIFLYRILRPCLLFFKLFKFPFRIH